jgi:protein SCO1/2
MTNKLLLSFLATAILHLAISCDSRARRFELTGSVVRIDREAGRVTVAHDNIPGFMDAMTMPFTVQEPGALDSLAPGDGVSAILVVTEEASWLEDLVVTRKMGEKATADSAVPPPPVTPEEPQPGQPVPGFSLVNQDGRPIHLAQYRGKALVLTFIYTRCPLPDFCPRMTRHFVELEESLNEEPELYHKTHLLSVSFDPEYDTPAVLKEYAQDQLPDRSVPFDHWELATGSEEEIKEITSFFGLSYWSEPDQIVHSLRTAVVGPDGTLFKLYRGNEWTPSEILSDLRKMEQ